MQRILIYRTVIKKNMCSINVRNSSRMHNTEVCVWQKEELLLRLIENRRNDEVFLNKRSIDPLH